MNLSTRIIFSVLLLLVVVTTSMLVGGRYIMTRVEKGLLTLTREGQLSAMDAVLSANEYILSEHARSITGNEDAMTAILEGDIDRAQDILTSAFNRISASDEASGLRIYALDGTRLIAFSRVPISAVETPDLVGQVARTGRRVFGTGRLGGDEYASIYAFPILEGREVRAVGVLSRSVRNSLPTIADTIGGAVVLTVEGDRSGSRVLALAATGPKHVRGHDHDHPEENKAGKEHFDRTYAVKLAENLRAAEQGKVGSVGLVESVDHTYVVTKDTLGSTVNGSSINILLVSDYSEQTAQKAFDFVIFTAITLALSVALMGLSFVWYRRQFQPLKQTVSIISRLQGGDRDIDISLADRKDEFGLLGRALVAFRNQIHETERLEAERVEAEAAQKEIERQRAEDQKQQDREQREAEIQRAAREKKRLEQEQAKEAERANENAKRAEQQKSVVEALRKALNGLSSGQLDVEISTAFPTEYDQLRKDFNATIVGLRQALSGVLQNASAIHCEIQEITDAATELSDRTSDQAGTLEETASALQEMTVSVQSTAGGAADATDLAKSAQEKAVTGNKVARQAMDEMDSIKQASEEISKITSLIDGIAFQTNLLALNAGVEAARAGEAGRGFAVVATEVRALAHRSAEAAKQINTQIAGSEAKIVRGVELVGRTSSALEDIVISVQEINERMADISSAAQEQATGLNDINGAMGNLDHVTQRNVAMVEETTTATRSLREEANALNAAIGQFQLGQSVPRGRTMTKRAS